MVVENSSARTEEVDIKAFLRMMDVASALRQQREEAEKQLDIHGTKADLRKRLLATAEITGEELIEAEVDAAIESYFSGLYSFVEPKKGFETALANLYVERGRIARVYIFPALAATALAAVLFGGVKTGDYLIRQAAEKRLEIAVEGGYQRMRSLQLEVSNLKEEVSYPGDPMSLENRLMGADVFFKEFCSDGSASDDISQQNYQVANQQWQSVKSVLDAVEVDVKKGKELVSARKELDTLVLEIRNANPPKPFLEIAESTYQQGLTSISNNELSKLQGYKKQLVTIKGDIQQFSVLPSEKERLYSSIRSIVKEAAALERVERLNREAELYIRSVDVKQLRQAVDELKSIDEILKQEYSLTVVSRSGVKSGIDRYYTDSGGKRSSGYYLIVEAIDTNGKAIKKWIKNEESGQTELVTMWGERVPAAVYERIKRDKQDDGIIQNNVFGRKEKGYLTETITMFGTNGRPLKKEGQITRW